MRVFKRESRWYFTVSVDGKRTRRSLPKARSKADAERLASEFVLRATQGVDRLLTLSEAGALYAGRSKDLPERWGAELQRVADFVRFAGPKKPVASISRSDVSRWQEHLEVDKQPATCRRYKTSVGAFFRWLVAHGHISTSPVQGAYSPKERPRKKLAPSAGELAAALQVSRGTPIEGAMMLAVYQGLRRSEIARARWDHVDLERGTIYVSGRKTARAEQVLPLHPDFATWARGRTQKGPIVPNKHGEHYHPAALENLRRDARVKLNFHLARHGLATLLLQSGQTLDDVAALLRISPRTAYEHYAWLSPQSRAKALSAFRLP